MQKISILIPAYNEEERIGKTLKTYSTYFSNLKKQGIIDYQLSIIINGTTDNTEQVVKQSSQKDGAITFINLKQGGKKNAIMKGLQKSLSEGWPLIGFVDADMSTRPEEFYDLIKNIGNNDGIIADRSKKESKTNMSFIRKITHTGFNMVVRSLLLLPYTDTQCGAKVFTNKTVQEIVKNGAQAQWAFDVEVLYNLHKKGYKIKSIPTIWVEEEGSKLNLLKTPFKMFSSIVRLRIVNSFLKPLIKLYDRLPERLKIHNL
jgi:glycosyltransferase involved in cell wall biosynthesis